MLSTINLYCALICCAFVFVLKYLLLNKACSVKSIFLGLGSYVNNTIIKNLNQYWEVLWVYIYMKGVYILLKAEKHSAD